MRSSAIRKVIAEETNQEAFVREVGDFVAEIGKKNLHGSSLQTEENPRIVPLKLSVEEARRAFKYQQTLLKYAIKQYKLAKGTDKEDGARKFFEESLRDFNDFIAEYKEELSK